MDLTQEIAIKANLLVEGLTIEEAALEGVGTKYKENVYTIFDYHRELQTGSALPADLRMPQGTICQMMVNPRSPYRVVKEDGVLLLKKDGKPLLPLEWLERPRFYDRRTTDGTEMKRVAQLLGRCCLICCFSNYCFNWEGGLECRFCNINATRQAHRDSILAAKRIEQVGEVTAAALEEIPQLHLIFTGGFLPGGKVADTMVRLMESLRSHSGREKVVVCANISAPADLTDIERVHRAGVTSVVYDLEVWDQNMFEAICPGKARNIGRPTYLRALEYAVPLFGRGYVVSNFVLGLEEKEKYFEGAAYLAEKGVVMTLQPWFPAIGSKLEGHRPPYGEWILEVNEKVVEITLRALPELLTDDYFYSGLMGCYWCNTLALFWDDLRRRRESRP